MSLLIIAIAPVLIIAFYIYFRDKYEKEPLGLLLLSLFAGCMIVIPVLLLGMFLKIPGAYITTVSASAAYEAWIIAAFLEEGMKWLVLMWLIWRNKNFNEKFDGIVYAVFVSLGFAMIENILYVFNGGMNTGLMRAVTAVPFHALVAVQMGYFIGLARFQPKWRTWNLFKSFMLPFIYHGLYNFLIMMQNHYLLILWFAFLIYLWRDVFKKISRHIGESPFRYE